MKVKSISKWKWPAAVAVLLLVAFVRPGDKYFDIARNLEIFTSLFKEVNAFYVDEIDPEKTIKVGIDAMLNSLDPYTNYIPAEDMAAYKTMTTGEYGGIGAYISKLQDKIVISMPNEGFPADQAGLKIGDELLKIDDTEVSGMNTNEVSKLLKGKPGTPVTLTVKRQDKVLTFELTRAKIVIDNVPYYGMVSDNIGYIQLTEFTTEAAAEVRKALLALKKQGASGIIFDLRDNPGGILQEAVDICNLFIPKGQVVVETKGKTPNWNKVYKTVKNPIDTEIPIVVLTNGNSASAAEIVSGTLQDYDRAVLLGRKTFGKGLVQSTRPVGYDSQVKITVAKYYTPSGRCIQAIDYAHRHADGSVDKIPDSLKTAFTTAHGRTVYDGGGITPDITTEAEYLAPVTVSLLTNGYFFAYANEYYYRHPQAPGMLTFEVSDKVYEDFISWLGDKELSYKTEAERALEEFEQKAREWEHYERIEPQIAALQQAVVHDPQRDLRTYEQEIKDLLGREILARYYLIKGEVAYSIRHDRDVAEAIGVLNDPARYRGLLQLPN